GWKSDKSGADRDLRLHGDRAGQSADGDGAADLARAQGAGPDAEPLRADAFRA
ncbi:MAG: NADH-ubiquinone oxidoreductase chain H, partial [uncultured Thermomicrobiales bacterium]